MIDTPTNRNKMEYFLTQGPNQDKTYQHYKLPWQK